MSHMNLETGLADFRSLSSKFRLAGYEWAQHQGFAFPVSSCLSTPPETSGAYWKLQWFLSQSQRTKQAPLWDRAPHQGSCLQLNYQGVSGCCQPAPAPTAAAPPAANPQGSAYGMPPVWRRLSLPIPIILYMWLFSESFLLTVALFEAISINTEE